MYIIVVGGGKVGYYLTKSLLEEGHEVLVIEQDPEQYAMLTDELEANALLGDGCEASVMAEAGLGRADVVVAVTGNDEDNLVVCQIAKHKFNVPRAIARINNPKNERIFRRLGIDETISSTTLLFQLIKQEVATSELVPLALLQRGRLEVLEVELPARSPAIDKPVRELGLPSGCLLAAVVRGSQAQVVTGDTMLHGGETVVVLAEPNAMAALRQALL